MSKARRIQSGRVVPQTLVATGRASSTLADGFWPSSAGFVRCRYATTPPDTNSSANPANVRCPSIIAGIAMESA